MANLFDKLIADMLKANGGKETEIIAALREKSAQYGDDATEEQVASALGECLRGQLNEEMDSATKETVIDEEAKARAEIAVAIAKEYLDEHDWKYQTRGFPANTTLFEMLLNTGSIRFTLRIIIETDPAVCRIMGLFPVAADALYDYPLCKLLMDSNFKRRFGCFKLDENDGEITYEYSFLIGSGLYKEDLHIYYRAVIDAITTCHDEIRKCCVGRFKQNEVAEITEKVNRLVADISQ